MDAEFRHMGPSQPPGGTGEMPPLGRVPRPHEEGVSEPEGSGWRILNAGERLFSWEFPAPLPLISCLVHLPLCLQASDVWPALATHPG